MRRRAGTGRNEAKKRTRRNARPRGAAKATHGSAPSIVDLQQQVEALTRELSEALEQQTATSEVLQVISRSSGALDPVFQAMLENATRVCQAKFGVMWLCEGGGFRSVALHGPAAHVEARRRKPVIYPGPELPLGRLARTRQIVHIADLAGTKLAIDREVEHG
jgi:hypothetical protein